MRPTLHIHLLGDFLLAMGETPVTTVTLPRVQSLLAYLVLHHDAPQDRSHLAFLLWPDSTEAQAHTNLRKLLYNLRQAFPDVDQFLHTDKHYLQWLPTSTESPFTLDVQEFAQALDRAEQARLAQDARMLRQALEQVLRLYRGDLLPNCYEEWIVPKRDRLRQAFLQSAERLSLLLEEERDYDAAVTIAQQLLRHDPLHEASYRRLMRLYALRGERAAALRVYHTCSTMLERELGTEPVEATRAAYEALVGLEHAAQPLSVRGAAPALLGRGTEWRQLQQVWRTAARHQPHIVLLSGEAGIGKTRLAEELEAWVSRQGMATASARCYAALGPLAYAPVTTWLRTDALQTGLAALDPAWLTEIARLLPELLTARPALPHPSAMTEGWQRQRFFEALARAVLSARQPLLLLLDDLQWCDHETLEWLHYLLRFDPQAHFLLVGTVRTEETFPGHPLLAFMSALQRDGMVTEIALVPLTTAETTSLAEHVTGRQLSSVVAKHLYAETEGNPLFVVEMVRAGTLEQCTLDQSLPLLKRSASTLSPTVQSVLVARLAQLSPLAHEVANVAAVIGREFAFPVLTRASGQSEDAVVRGLDELWQRRIVREQGAGTAETYDFSHDKLRTQVYTSLSPTSRRILHRRVAEAFKAAYVTEQDAVSGQIAAHYEHANLTAQAIPYYQRAGEAASRIYANIEAIHAFERAIALLEAHVPGHTQQEVPWETAVRVYEALGDVSLEIGRHQEARQAYNRAITYIPGDTYLWRARLQRKVANSWNHLSNNPRDASHTNASQAFEEAERLLTSIADPANPAWRREWADLQFAQIWPLRGSEDHMTAVIEKARPVIEQYGTEEQRELFVYAMAMRDLVRLRYVVSEQKISSLRSKLTPMQGAGDQSKKGIGYLALGGALLFAGQITEAEEQLGYALRIAEQTGIVWLQARCLTFLSFIYRRRGQVEQVRTMIKRAQDVGVAQNNSVLTGHYAWIAWREGDLAEAETAGHRSVDRGQQQVNPFQWTGLWPLLGVALAQEKIAEAVDDVRMLLDPTQQPPPEPLAALLAAALQAWEADRQEEAHMLLQQAVPLARDMGYL